MKGVVFVGVPADGELQPVREAIARWEIPWDHVFDAKGYQAPLWTIFNVEEQPSFYVFDRKGRIAAKRAEAKHLAGLLEKLTGK